MGECDRRTMMLGASAMLSMAAQAQGSASSATVPGTQPDALIDLWPDGPPGAPKPLPSELVQERSTDPAAPDRALLHIARPRLALFRAPHPMARPCW